MFIGNKYSKSEILRITLHENVRYDCVLWDKLVHPVASLYWLTTAKRFVCWLKFEEYNYVATIQFTAIYGDPL